MSVENRAKQFMPFAALPGLEEALARKEAEMAAASVTEYEPVEETCAATEHEPDPLQDL